MKETTCYQGLTLGLTVNYNQEIELLGAFFWVSKPSIWYNQGIFLENYYEVFTEMYQVLYEQF